MVALGAFILACAAFARSAKAQSVFAHFMVSGHDKCTRAILTNTIIYTGAKLVLVCSS